MSPSFFRALRFLLGLTVLAAPSFAAAPVRLGDDVVPVFQAIDLLLDGSQPQYRGSVRIDLEVRRTTASFRFHSRGQEIGRLELTGAAGAIETRWQREGEDMVVVSAGEPLAEGRYTLEIELTGAFGDQGRGLFKVEKDGESYIFSHFQPIHARDAIPCWDEPSFKIPFQLTLTVPEGQMAVTNTPLAEETVRDGWRRMVFEPTPPLPSYLLNFTAGPLETVPIPGLGVPGRVVTVRGQSSLAATAIEITPPILKALESYFGREYPYRKLDLIAVPGAWFAGMEHPGAVIFSDGVLLLDPKSADLAQRRRQANLIAHELAHMWFGDLVTMKWWDDLWLNESFATWMADKITREVFPQYRQDLVAAADAQTVLERDALATTPPIHHPVESIEDLVSSLPLAYDKGRAVLGMFESWLGPERFRRGVLELLQEHAWGTATAADLWSAFDQATGGESTASAALATFINQPGFPRVDVNWLPDGRIELRQERYRNLGATSEDATWKVPVALRYPRGGSTATTTVLLDGPSRIVDLGEPAPAWIFPNADARGFYRWRLPDDRLRALAEVAGTALGAAERVELMGSLSALENAGLLRPEVYLHVLAQLAAAPEPLVVNAVLGALANLRWIYVTPELSAPFGRYVRRSLRPALDRFGREHKAGEEATVAELRSNLLFWLGAWGGDAEVLSYGRDLAHAYLADPGTVDPALVGTALRLAALDGDRQLFDRYRERLEATENPAERGRFLTALASFRDPELQKAAFLYALERSANPTDLYVMARAFADDFDSHLRVFQMVADHYQELAERLPEGHMAYAPKWAERCNADVLAAADAFFAQPEHQVPGLEEIFAEVRESVTNCLEKRQRGGAAVASYLRQAAAAP